MICCLPHHSSVDSRPHTSSCRRNPLSTSMLLDCTSSSSRASRELFLRRCGGSSYVMLHPDQCTNTLLNHHQPTPTYPASARRPSGTDLVSPHHRSVLGAPRLPALSPPSQMSGEPNTRACCVHHWRMPLARYLVTLYCHWF